jgi:phytoene dehydrogenase-like protein
MKSQVTETDVVIVGGGLAGLSAACYLARGGVAVTLFEKAAHLGGRASTQVYDGYAFNRGIHALYCGGAASEVLQELGVPYSGHSPQDLFALRAGRLYPLPADPLTMLRTDLLDLGGKWELLRWFAGLPRLNPAKYGRVSVQDWIARTIRRPAVRQLVSAVARTAVYSAALDQVSADVLIVKLQLQLKAGIKYIDGGWQTLVDGLRRAAEQAGARIVSDMRVTAVEHGDGSGHGVRLEDGSLVRAAAVILATSPQDAVRLVDGGAYPALRSIVAGLVPAQIACLDVALRRMPDPRHPIVQDLERPRFLSTQSRFAQIAPEGGALIHTFKQLDQAQPTDPHADEHDLEDLLDRVQPGWREVLVKRVYLPRIDAAGMLPMAATGGYAGRPGPRVPGLAHLYLAGDWIGAGFLADAGLSSARQVAHLLLDGDLAAARATAHPVAAGAGR